VALAVKALAAAAEAVLLLLVKGVGTVVPAPVVSIVVLVAKSFTTPGDDRQCDCDLPECERPLRKGCVRNVPLDRAACILRCALGPARPPGLKHSLCSASFQVSNSGDAFRVLEVALVLLLLLLLVFVLVALLVLVLVLLLVCLLLPKLLLIPRNRLPSAVSRCCCFCASLQVSNSGDDWRALKLLLPLLLVPRVALLLAVSCCCCCCCPCPCRP
jgi:hypothetical protein